jgi:hypothetical protein
VRDLFVFDSANREIGATRQGRFAAALLDEGAIAEFGRPTTTRCTTTVHLYLAESDPERRKAWIAAIDTIEALDPRAVISGHKRAGRADDPHTLEETRRYIRDFDRVDAVTTTARELYDQMLAISPKRVNPGVLWISARTVKP